MAIARMPVVLHPIERQRMGGDRAAADLQTYPSWSVLWWADCL